MKFLLALLTLVPLLAWSADFDCHQASGPTERAICADAELSRLDAQLAQTYRDALQANAKDHIQGNRRGLIREQKNWLTYVRNVCADAACLRAAYQARIELLQKHPLVLDEPQKFNLDVNRSHEDLMDPRTVDFIRDPKENMADFSKVLTEKGTPGKIIGCDKVIVFSTGLDGQVDGDTFAGICTLEKQKKRMLVQICYTPLKGLGDSMESTDVQSISEAGASYEKLMDFAIKKCL
jgi:uncharacterized protein